VPSSIENGYSTLRQRTAAALRKNLWLAAAATIACCAALAATILLQSHWLIVTAAAAGVVVTAFVWGYTTRAFRVPPYGPTLGHLHRRQYAETWDTLAHLDELDRWRYVQEAFRVLRVGGRIFIDNIDLESDQGWASFLGLVAKYLNAEQPPYMTRFSTASELMTYATRAGFEQVRSHERPPLVIMTAVKPSAAG